MVPVEHPEPLPGVLTLEQRGIGDPPAGVESLLVAVGDPGEPDARARAIGVLQVTLELDRSRPVHRESPALTIEAVVALDRLGQGVSAGAELTAGAAELHEPRYRRLRHVTIRAGHRHDRVDAGDDEQRDRVSIFRDRKSTRLNSSHGYISYAVFCL